jgi:hypothetical protein
MKTNRSLIYQLAGMVMIVGSFFCVAQAVGGLLTSIFITASTDFSQDNLLSDTVRNLIFSTHIPAAASGIASFFILFFGGRWILKGPRLIERWIAESKIHEEAPQSADSE